MDDWFDDSRDNASYEKDMWRRNLQHMSEKHKNVR